MFSSGNTYPAASQNILQTWDSYWLAPAENNTVNGRSKVKLIPAKHSGKKHFLAAVIGLLISINDAGMRLCQHQLQFSVAGKTFHALCWLFYKMPQPNKKPLARQDSPFFSHESHQWRKKAQTIRVMW
jgi:hypothetical protein